MDFLFIMNNLLLGAGLSMDAFSVSVSNGLAYPGMKRKYRILTAGIYGLFQFLMPLSGWFCVKVIEDYSVRFRQLTPWISLTLLCYIGLNMIIDGWKEMKDGAYESSKSGIVTNAHPPIGSLLLQGIATSIDALSVGFVIAGYGFVQALIASSIIGAITFGICVSGVRLGKVFGDMIGSRAMIAGGIILILIGLEIFLS